ncbi:hypothetical protein [Mariniblastus fucicola]|uniref:Uncharacterized protein n=1 Tax=Mariniblastus fucicola TaxID=980251 RepID=A0A5B9PHB4_9BACT|nr:hypothetical protein [Mariniblastus fucicola]QEG22251.1 hypothetical protein MFFC18_21270 [Mariniblastus fucicola]
MKNFIAYALHLLASCLFICGIVGVTCWGCFQKHQNAWWLLGFSSTLGTFSIIAINFATFQIDLRQRVLNWLVPCALAFVLILIGIWIGSRLPRTGPSRRADLFQLASLAPLLTICLSFTPYLMRIYRGIALLRTDESSKPSEKPASEFAQLATLFGIALALPIAANVAINHLAGPVFLILSAIACSLFGMLILYPLILILMKFDWTAFICIAVALFLVTSSTIASILVANAVALTPREIAITTTAILSGPTMLMLYCAALRLQGFRILIPPRRFRTNSTSSASGIHPLDA